MSLKIPAAGVPTTTATAPTEQPSATDGPAVCRPPVQTARQPMSASQAAKAATTTNTAATNNIVSVKAGQTASKDPVFEAFKNAVEPKKMTPAEAKTQRNLVREFFTNEGFRIGCMTMGGMNDDLLSIEDDSAREAAEKKRSKNVSIDYIETTPEGGGTIYMSLPDDTEPVPNQYKVGIAIYKTEEGYAPVASIDITPEIEAASKLQVEANAIKSGMVWQADLGILTKPVQDLTLHESELVSWNLKVVEGFGDDSSVVVLVALGSETSGVNVQVTDEGYAPAAGFDAEEYYAAKNDRAKAE